MLKSLLNSSLGLSSSRVKKVMPNHSCLDSLCDGAKLFGLNLTCNRCLKPCFFECIERRPEVLQLLEVLNVIDADNDHKRRVINAVNKIFTSESVFKFACPKCRDQGSFNDLKQSCERYRSERDSARIELKKAKEECVSLKMQIPSQIDSLKTTAAQWSEQIQQQNEYYAKFLSTIDILESSDDVASQKNTAQSPSTRDTQQSHNVESLSSQSQHLHDPKAVNNRLNVKADIHSPAIINEPAIDLTHSTHSSDHHSRPVENQGHSSANNNNDKVPLRPPANVARKSKQTKSSSHAGNVFEIYVSKFVPETTCEDIANHIAKSTSLQNDSQFNVELLSSNPNRLKRKTFVSFKVTALKKSVCDMILDEKVWSPKFSASLFDHNKVKKPSNQRTPTTNAPKQSKSSSLQPPRRNSPPGIGKSKVARQPKPARPIQVNPSRGQLKQHSIAPATVARHQYPLYNQSPMQYPQQNFWTHHNGLMQPPFAPIYSATPHVMYQQPQPVARYYI